MADYYSVLARAISRLPSKTDAARRAVYERARTALLEHLDTYDPPLSETALVDEQAALEMAISRVDADVRRAPIVTIARYIVLLITGAAFVAGLVGLIRTHRTNVSPAVSQLEMNSQASLSNHPVFKKSE